MPLLCFNGLLLPLSGLRWQRGHVKDRLVWPAFFEQEESAGRITSRD